MSDNDWQRETYRQNFYERMADDGSERMKQSDDTSKLNNNETAQFEGREIQMEHRPDRKRDMCNDIVGMLRNVTRIESDFENMDVGHIDYQTVQPAIHKARMALKELSDVYQARIYRRQNGDRAIRTGVQRQDNPRRW